MNIPDLISPIVAYRTWTWDAMGLQSLNHVPWVPGEAMKAECRASGAHPFVKAVRIWNEATGEWDLEPESDTHHAPAEGCSCGLYAAKNLKHLHNIGYIEFGHIHGEIYLWGRVCDHTLGYRAEFAYPKSLVIPTNVLPFNVKEAMQHIEPLMLYNVDILLTEGAYKGVPQKEYLLYKKDAGLQQTGLDFIVEYQRKWYLWKDNVHTLEVGDRVSVRDKGMGIVRCIKKDAVEILLWSHTSLAVNPKQIKWDKKNNRWESDSCGYETYLPKAQARL